MSSYDGGGPFFEPGLLRSLRHCRMADNIFSFEDKYLAGILGRA
jgi:hypothetical protein